MRENGLHFNTLSLLLVAVGLSMLVWLFPSEALASDHYNLEEGIPTELEDSIPTAYRNREIQGYFRWEHVREDENELRAATILEYGIWRNTEVALEVPFMWGSAVDEDGIGDVGIHALYNFNQETAWIPAFALTGALEFPTADDSEGVDTTLKLILSKTLGRSTLWNRLHLNLAWKHNSEAEADEREDYYMAVVGWDVRVGPDTLLIIDFVREEEKKENEEANIIEAGIRYQLTPLTLLAAGAGAGIEEESPDVRVALGFQHSF